MVQHGSISAWVTVNGRSLEEYGEEWNEAKDKVTCWIPSEAGKEFQLHLKHENALYDTSTRFYIDGTVARRLRMPSSLTRRVKKYNNTTSCTSIKTSPTTARALLFSKLQLSDDDSLLNCIAPEVGEIRIEHLHIRIVAEDILVKSIHSFKEVRAVHERLKKGTVTHCTGLGVEKMVSQNRHSRSADVAHLLTVIFRYRPLDVLQANGIAPLPPPLPLQQPVASTSNKRPAPPVDVIDISSDDSDDDAHIAKLKAELARALTRKQKKIKREHVKITSVKTEASLKSEA